MPTRLERLEGALAEAAAAVRRSGARLRKARADRLAAALAAPTPAERLAALDDPILTRVDRRTLREHVGVSLAPESPTEPPRKRRSPFDRVQVAFARWRPNPFSLAITVLVGGSIVTTFGFAWAHTGRGARMSGLCRNLVLTRSDGTTRQRSLSQNSRVVVRWQGDEAVTIALWAHLSGYETATVRKRCLEADR
ncbi:hypothetical protein G3T14_21950 [Methylobacterium sp. BTF04]|uniref:hypothetical protein n=1 Tax=Methylobacterium sp. BTF04 TaxID=2708300 RepID=UPI0013D2C7AB|nr:hypothetical protein [Methylobacterium sp. BTF04]NEU14745.1 hypothetical protein [Methylobacterium sp. BTF04]